MEEKKFLSVTEASEYLGNVHPASLRRWSNKGLIPCYRFGIRGDRRFLIADLDTFIEHSKDNHTITLTS